MDKPEGLPEDLLKKMRVRSLEPGLQKEIFEFADGLGLERTISTKSDLATIVGLCSSKKGRMDSRALKKAEKILGAISHLQRSAVQKAMREEPEQIKRHKTTPKTAFSEAPEQTKMGISKDMLDLFAKIGIKDERIIGQALERFGEDGSRERIELVQISNIDLGAPNLLVRLFSERPSLILIPRMEDFLGMIQEVESKIMIIDNWRIANPDASVPSDADYSRNPGILLESYADIVKKLRLQIPNEPTPNEETEAEEEKKKVRHAPINPNDFVKTLQALGFEVTRNGPHRMLTHPDGRTAVVQSEHVGEFRPGLIRTKLREIGIDEEDFVKARIG